MTIILHVHILLLFFETNYLTKIIIFTGNIVIIIHHLNSIYSKLGFLPT